MIREALPMNKPAGRITVHGFPRSTYVGIVRIVLTHKGADYTFNDLETKMGGKEHHALHPFGRVPILEHGGFRLYETSAIVHYLEDILPRPRLMPEGARERGEVHQWISAVNGYFYPYLVYHLVHERLVFPPLGIPADEKVVAAALPRIETCLDVAERALEGRSFLVGDALSLADFFLYPSMFALNLTAEGQAMIPRRRALSRWLAAMDGHETVVAYRAVLPPREPIEHARAWVDGHRPKY
jgi:glutathione S-transferase